MRKLDAEWHSTGLFENQCLISIDNILIVDKEIVGTKPTIEYINGFIDGIKVLYPNIVVNNKDEVRQGR